MNAEDWWVKRLQQQCLHPLRVPIRTPVAPKAPEDPTISSAIRTRCSVCDLEL
jgi:hypothetical protein